MQLYGCATLKIVCICMHIQKYAKIYVKQCAVNLIWSCTSYTKHYVFRLLLCCSVAHNHGLRLLNRMLIYFLNVSQSSPRNRHADFLETPETSKDPNLCVNFSRICIQEGNRTCIGSLFLKLRYNLHAIKSTLIKCTLQWFLVRSRVRAHPYSLILGHLYYPIKGPRTR